MRRVTGARGAESCTSAAALDAYSRALLQAEDCTKRPAPGQLTSTRRPPLAELPAGASGSKLCGHDAAPPRQCEVDIQSLKEFAVATGCSEQQITLRWWELGTLMNLVGWRTNDQMLSVRPHAGVVQMPAPRLTPACEQMRKSLVRRGILCLWPLWRGSSGVLHVFT